jgi:4-aminobutyrate aminotransferase/(S)-3-amino-2-methylpropionate transaminase
VLIEPIQGEGGFVVPARGFLPALADWTKVANVLLIADEIQTGLCRTGAWYASGSEGIEPDLVTTGKALAGGLPLSAVTGTAAVLDAVHPGGLGGTYGGNPVACAAALATLDLMAERGLCAAARHIEEVLRSRLDELARRHGAVGQVRGRGAMLAVEVVVPGTDGPGGPRPDPGATAAVAKACHRAGLLVLTCGTYGNVLRLLPPLVCTDAELHRGLDIIDAAFAGATQ